MLVIGIDIGLTGAVCRLGGGFVSTVVDIPTMPDGDLKPGRGNAAVQPRRINGRQMLNLLRELVPPGYRALAVMEDVKARPMGNAEKHFNSFHSQNSLVLSRGCIQAVLDIADMQTLVVQPQTWKKLFGLGGASKDDSLDMARKLYPDLADELKLKKYHNRAEALLVGHWAMRTQT